MSLIQISNNRRLSGLLARRWVRALALTLAVLLLTQTVLFFLSLRAAQAHLAANDPRQLQNRSEMSVFFAPFVVARGQHLTPAQVVAHLQAIAYNENTENAVSAPASYALNGDTLDIVPRVPEFPHAVVVFRKGRVAALSANDQPVERLELEPLPMQNFVRFVHDDQAKSQRTRRLVVAAGSVPPLVADTVTSAEDYRFFQHHGLDWLAVAGRVASSRFAEGGSGITQQLIKNNVVKGAQGETWQLALGFLSPKLRRKVMEVPFALSAEELMTKDEILAAYLSMVPLGAANGVELHGIVAAAQEYFDKPLNELTLAEAATLAGMINSPSSYVNFVRHNNSCPPEVKPCKDLTARRNRVLGLLGRNQPERYPAAVIAQAQAEPVHFVWASTQRGEATAETESRQFATYAAQHLPDDLAQLRTTEGSLRVYTTLDAPLQQAAVQAAVAAQQRWQPKIAALCQRAKPTGVDCAKLAPQVALVALEASTGHILAMAGGVNASFNYAVDAQRAPASAIKPFYYLKALESGTYRGQPFTAATLIDPLNDVLKDTYRPDNHVGSCATARVHLAQSYNFGACAAADAAGVKVATEFVGRLTGTRPQPTGLSALGGTSGAETNLLALTQAYLLFPNGGQLRTATPYRAYAVNDTFTVMPSASLVRVADAGAVFITTDMLRSVVTAGGTAANFRTQAGLPATVQFAGKTGTGVRADMWFVGFTPRLVVGVWVGLPDNELQLKLDEGFSGGNIAAPVAAEFLRQVGRQRPELLGGEFVRPAHVVTRRVNATGCAVANGGREEVFLAGREPQSCGR